MGKIVVTEFVSLDGVMEDPGGAEGFEYGGWTFKFDRGDEGNKFKLDETMSSDALLLAQRVRGHAAILLLVSSPVMVKITGKTDYSRFARPTARTRACGSTTSRCTS